ncbi:Hypothetical predicted protein, partial [Paramuricea clavata]
RADVTKCKIISGLAITKLSILVKYETYQTLDHARALRPIQFDSNIASKSIKHLHIMQILKIRVTNFSYINSSFSNWNATMKLITFKDASVFIYKHNEPEKSLSSKFFNKFPFKRTGFKEFYIFFIDLAKKLKILPVTCTALRKIDRSLPSAVYKIKPINADAPFRVYCDMISKNGIGVTDIGHDSESRTFVKDYSDANRKITYILSMKQIVAVIKMSVHCEQFIKYECHHSVFNIGSRAWWKSRQGSKMNYWGGAAVNSGKCACGMTNSCDGGGKCNCNKNDAKWREDGGLLTDKNTLPVIELQFHDLGGSSEFGYYTLGKLRCWG